VAEEGELKNATCVLKALEDAVRITMDHWCHHKPLLQSFGDYGIGSAFARVREGEGPLVPVVRSPCQTRWPTSNTRATSYFRNCFSALAHLSLLWMRARTRLAATVDRVHMPSDHCEERAVLRWMSRRRRGGILPREQDVRLLDRLFFRVGGCTAQFEGR
jgi:hypothetical protein